MLPNAIVDLSGIDIIAYFNFRNFKIWFSTTHVCMTASGCNVTLFPISTKSVSKNGVHAKRIHFPTLNLIIATKEQLENDQQK